MKGIQVTKETMKDVARLYVKKPFAVRAMQINQTFWVESLEGNHQGKEGDYLIEGIKGELYICDKEIFEQSYDLLNPDKKSKDEIFINHIKSHLKNGEVVICKICGKGAEEIIKEDTNFPLQDKFIPNV